MDSAYHSAKPLLHLLLLIAMCAAGSAAEPPLRDFGLFMGIARGDGEVTVSPRRGFAFDSPAYADVAFAQTAGPLPLGYTLSIHVTNVDIEYSGCRFGVFEEEARFSGDNDTINGLCKYAVVFQEVRGERSIYLWYFTDEGDYYCFDGAAWQQNSWRPTRARWEPKTAYTIEITRGAAGFSCRVSQGETELFSAPAVDCASARGAATGDYLAFGDMVRDFVRGRIEVSSVDIEEQIMRPYLEHDIEHVTIRQAPPGRYAMYGGLTKLPDGEVLCVYKVGSLDDKGSPWTVRDEVIVWSQSEGQGRVWPPLEDYIYDNPETRQENCCGKGYMNGAGVLMHPFYVLNADYEEQAQEQNWSRLHLAATGDRGGTWDIRRVETPFCIAASFGGLLRLRDGEVLLGVYGAVEPGSFRHQAGHLRSHDDGATWSDYRVIGEHADPDGGPARLNETDIAQLPDGKLVAMSRTQYDGFPLYRSQSTDGGQSWTTGPSGLTGLCPALWYSPSGPPEGTLVLAYHDRWGEHALHGGVYLACSQDGGATWGEPLWISGGAYPCMVALDDGSVFCSYYQTNSLLRASIFKVPFPSGLHTASSPAGLLVRWDAYSGEKAEAYRYAVYRSREAPVQAGPDGLLGEVAGNQFVDETAEPGRVYCYRVVALEGEEEVGRSWQTVGRRVQEGP